MSDVPESAGRERTDAVVAAMRAEGCLTSSTRFAPCSACDGLGGSCDCCGGLGWEVVAR